MNWPLVLFLTLLSFSSAAQKTGTVSGNVTDEQTSEALPGATVSVVGNTFSVVTDAQGAFSLINLPEGKVELVITYIGYKDLIKPVTVKADKTTIVSALLALDHTKGSQVVVTVSKRPEKITRVAASIQVIGIKDFQQTAGYNVQEMLSNVQGIEFTRYGIDGITINARGMNSAFNNKVLQVVDGRNCMSALSANLPIYSINAGTYIKEDLDRIEIVLGPQTALYGPNANNVVLNFISKDPRIYTGTSAAVAVGNHNQFSAQLRYAAKINNHWAYKLTGGYSKGTDFIFYDSVRAGGQKFGPAVHLPERNVNFDYKHIQGEAGIYYNFTPQTSIVLSGGGSANNTIQVTTQGRNQMVGVTYGFVQAKLVSPHVYGTIYNTWGNIGNSYSITSYTANFWNYTHRKPSPASPDSAEAVAKVPFKETSQRLNAELQYNYQFQKQGLFLVAGLNYQHESPNGYGINLIDSFQRIHIYQYGAAMQLEKSLPFNMNFIAAVRMDHHSNFGNYFAPKIALTKNFANTSFRISWAKAYAMPNILQQYAGNGFYFGNGGTGIKFIPNKVPVNDPAMVKNTIPLVPDEVDTWEFGFKGNLTDKLFLDITFYSGSSKNFIGPPVPVPGRALSVNGIKVNPSIPGKVDSNGILDSASFITNFNYGSVKSYGMDFGLNYQFSRKINLALRYSYFNSDITKGNAGNDADKNGVVSPAEKSLNAPQNRGAVILSFQNLCKEKLYINLAARYVQQYDFYSGSQNGTKKGEGTWGANFDWGPLGGFTSFDINAGYQINPVASVSLGIANIFNTKQIEMVGSPSIGQLIIASVRITVPDPVK